MMMMTMSTTSKNHGDAHGNSSPKVDEGNYCQDVGNHLFYDDENHGSLLAGVNDGILTSRAPPMTKLMCRLPGRRLSGNHFAINPCITEYILT